MYKDLLLESYHVIFFIIVASFLVFCFFRIYSKYAPLYYHQKYLIQEQHNLINALDAKVKSLYNNIFELEELCEQLIHELKNHVDKPYIIEGINPKLLSSSILN